MRALFIRLPMAACLICCIGCPVSTTATAKKAAATTPKTKKAAEPRVDQDAVIAEAKKKTRTPTVAPPDLGGVIGDKKSYPPLPPGVGKVAPSKINRENYRKLALDMPLDEVEKLLGPGKELSRIRTSLNMEWASPGRSCVILITFQGAREGYVPTLLSKSIRD